MQLSLGLSQCSWFATAFGCKRCSWWFVWRTSQTPCSSFDWSGKPCTSGTICVLLMIYWIWFLCHLCALTFQANWYLEWHLDILIVWALAKVGETSRAHELLEGLKFRLVRISSLLQFLIDTRFVVNLCLFLQSIKDEQEETTCDAERGSGLFPCLWLSFPF